MYSDSTERSFAGALVFFLVMALSAYVLLVTALVFWLAELLCRWQRFCWADSRC